MSRDNATTCARRTRPRRIKERRPRGCGGGEIRRPAVLRLFRCVRQQCACLRAVVALHPDSRFASRPPPGKTLKVKSQRFRREPAAVESRGVHARLYIYIYIQFRITKTSLGPYNDGKTRARAVSCNRVTKSITVPCLRPSWTPTARRRSPDPGAVFFARGVPSPARTVNNSECVTLSGAV